MSNGYTPRVLRPDSPAITNYPAATSTRPSASQRALLARLAQHNGQLELAACHAAVLAGLVRRGLVEIDDTHARLRADMTDTERELADAEHDDLCPACGGSGEIVDCPRSCDGSHVADVPYVCRACDGTGER